MFSSYQAGSVPVGLYAVQRENVFPERPDQPECQSYMKTGDCKFGAVCKFHHPRERIIPTPNCALSPLGLPLRPVRVSIHVLVCSLMCIAIFLGRFIQLSWLRLFNLTKAYCYLGERKLARVLVLTWQWLSKRSIRYSSNLRKNGRTTLPQWR